MSNVGKKFPSETETYIDKKSGREITRLTKTGLNYHMYFTENSFVEGDKEIYYFHSDGGVEDKKTVNVFKMDLETGESTQLTDFDADLPGARAFTKTKDGKYILIMQKERLYKLDVEKNEYTLLYTGRKGFVLRMVSISYDNRYVAIIENEDTAQKVKSSGNYAGFKDRFYDLKHAFIVIANMDGSGAVTVFEDTHQLAHIQFAPDTNEYISYCHEGPWNYVQQRIWILNTITRHVEPCYRQKENDSVGHEFWTRDGLMFFDNRGRGHDGTITSDKTQAVTISHDGPDDIPIVGFCDKQCNVLRTVELPYYCNHYHANKDNTLLVADAVDDIVLLDISKDKPSLEVLCEHNTSWHYQQSHGHPCWSWSNDKILFASDRDKEGFSQIYMVKMK